MNRILLLLSLICSCISTEAKWINPPFSQYLPTEHVPIAKSAQVEYKNIYETPQTKSFTIAYNWANDNREVSYKYMESTYTIEFDADNNIIHWKQEYIANYEPAVIEYFYVYDELNRVIERYTPELSRVNFYYNEENISTLVFWQYEPAFDKWMKMEKMDFEYYDGGYDCKLYSYNNETDEYKYLRTTRYSLNEDGKVIFYKDVDSSAGQEHQYVFNEHGYAYLISWYGADHASYKYEYVYNERGDLSNSIYSEWNGSYWKPCITENYTYEYLDSGIDEIYNNENPSYRYYNINGIETYYRHGLIIRVDNNGQAEKLFIK